MMHFVTIVLNGMPFIGYHLPTFQRLPFPWRWHISEGVAAPMHCTHWCQSMVPGLSVDGTTQYLQTLKAHPNIAVYQKEEWQGKIEMVNAGAAEVKEGDIVLQVDVDELWTDTQLALIHAVMEARRDIAALWFRCRYFVGPDLVVVGLDGYGNKKDFEWQRCWRAGKDFRFTCHEPPATSTPGPAMLQDETECMGLVFDHYAYATETQVAFKEKYYGYSGALSHWWRLQKNTLWPARLRDFFPWVTTNNLVMPLYESGLHPAETAKQSLYGHGNGRLSGQ